MSAVKQKVRRLERFRAKIKSKSVTQPAGRGKADARAVKAVNLQAALALKKASSKAAREFDSLNVEELKGKLDDARKELFNLRFKQATGQLERVSDLGFARRRIARILTLIKQKEVGA